MASPTRPTTLNVSLDDLAKMIDHSLLHPTMTDDQVLAGLQISRKYNVATGTTYPSSSSSSKDWLTWILM
jgi:deoxyribose-phosphate aldolase